MREFLIDTDPGVDDTVALALAFCLPGLELVGLTSVGGNASIDETTRNLASLLQALGQEQIPFAKGAAKQFKALHSSTLITSTAKAAWVSRCRPRLWPPVS